MKGDKLPHTPEWEKKRLDAVRAACAKRRGIPTNRPPTEKVKRALSEWKNLNPDKAKSIYTANLPKDCSGSKNGNWRGGKARIRQEWRSKHSSQIAKFRKLIKNRDKVCRDCGSTEKLEVHHIVGLAQCKEAFFAPMNAVLLCRKCHKKTDNYCSRGRSKPCNGKPFIIILTIPNHWHEYPTCGNWSWCEDILIVFVSKMTDERSEVAVAIHEVTEAMDCKKRGVTEKQVCEFDKLFEQNRMPGNDDEPGDDPRAPYRESHQRANHVERAVCHALDVLWGDHERAVQATQ